MSEVVSMPDGEYPLIEVLCYTITTIMAEAGIEAHIEIRKSDALDTLVILPDAGRVIVTERQYLAEYAAEQRGVMLDNSTAGE